MDGASSAVSTGETKKGEGHEHSENEVKTTAYLAFALLGVIWGSNFIFGSFRG